jgi:hypothetical protein
MLFAAPLVWLLGVTETCFAASGHYSPATWNTRDFFVPDPGYYAGVYLSYFDIGGIKDRRGSQVQTITANTNSGPVTFNISLNANIVMASPEFIYAPDWGFWGAHYAAALGVPFGNSEVSAAFSSEEGLGEKRTVDQFGLGDIYVEPLWLDWKGARWEASLAYGFYAPTGKYETASRVFAVPGVTLNAPSPENIGLGFWTQQFQQAAAWYPFGDPATAVALAVTEELHSKKRDLDDKPGSNVSFNWGISQYCPLKGKELVLDVGPTGYFSWQVSEDRGKDAVGTGGFTQISAAGVQIGVLDSALGLEATFRYLNEFSARTWFNGQWLQLSLQKKLK